jgi:hypothetical protein
MISLTKVSIDPTALQGFRDSVRGQVIIPGDTAYDEARMVFNLMIDKKPVAIVRCAGVVAKVPGQRLGFKQSLVRFLLGNIVMPDVIKSKDIELKTIAESGLNWTVLRPPLMTTGKATGNVAASEKDMALSKIDVDDITDFILSLLLTHEWDCKAPIVSSRKHVGVAPQPY